MFYSKCNMSLITNYSAAKATNSNIDISSCSTLVIEPVCLLLTQYATKRNLKVGTSLVYFIYIINNTKCNIQNIKLKDSLPKGVKFLSTSVEHGKYKYIKNSIFYNVHTINSHSFSKIAISVLPITLGKKVNSIEVICEKAKCTMNNPCKVSSIVSLSEDC